MLIVKEKLFIRDNDFHVSPEYIILIVSSDLTIVTHLANTLSPKSKIFVASSGPEGCRLCRQILPDMVIAEMTIEGDYKIPFTTLLKEDPILNYIPLLLILPGKDCNSVSAALKLGATEMIALPINSHLLLEKANLILQSTNHINSYFFNYLQASQTLGLRSDQDQIFLKKCARLVLENLTEKYFNVSRLSFELGMGRSNLYKKIKVSCNLSTNKFIRNIRLQKAAEILINTDLNVTQTALRVGINDVRYFREEFNKFFKLTPSKFISEHRQRFRDYNNNLISFIARSGSI